MPRPKTFDEREVLIQIAALFWRQGYTATSMDQISKQVSLRKTSLYNAYGDKAALFRQVVDWYVEEVVGRRIGLLTGKGSVAEEFGGLMRQLLCKPESDIAVLGCLLVNSVCELEHSAPELFRYVRERIALIPAAFEGYLAAAVADGRLAPHARPPVLARYLITTYQGMVMQARLAGPAREVDQIIDMALMPLQALALESHREEASPA